MYTQFIQGMPIPKSKQDLQLKIQQCYTNRALCYSQMGSSPETEAKIIADCDYVLKELDPRNVKALYRRKEVYKSQQKYSDALRDLDLLL